MSAGGVQLEGMLRRYLTIGWVGTLDLILGTGVAGLVSGLFAHFEMPSSLTAGNDLAKFAVVTWLQMFVTLIIGHDLRLMTYGAMEDDVTGGILFILSLFRQPNFWTAVDQIRTALWQMVYPKPTGAVAQSQSE